MIIGSISSCVADEDCVGRKSGHHSGARAAEPARRRWSMANVVVLSIRAGSYFDFNRVGSEIWAMLAEPRRVAGILDALAQNYDVDSAYDDARRRPFPRRTCRCRAWSACCRRRRRPDDGGGVAPPLFGGGRRRRLRRAARGAVYAAARGYLPGPAGRRGASGAFAGEEIGWVSWAVDTAGSKPPDAGALPAARARRAGHAAPARHREPALSRRRARSPTALSRMPGSRSATIRSSAGAEARRIYAACRVRRRRRMIRRHR